MNPWRVMVGLVVVNLVRAVEGKELLTNMAGLEEEIARVEGLMRQAEARER